MGGNGNHGPLAYSPLLNVLLDALTVYFFVSIIMFVVSTFHLEKTKKVGNIGLIANVLIPVILIPTSVVLLAFLEEGN
jgi:hypothetical protein